VTARFPNDPIVPLRDQIDLNTVDAASKRFWGRLNTPSFKKPLESIVSEHGSAIIHHHGIWLRCTQEVASFSRQHGLPYLISPRGMLEPWSLNNSKWKKKIAWMLYARKCCEGAAAFHATAESEAESIRRLGFKQPIAVIPNGVELPNHNLARNPAGAKKTALFLSRINPKKGLPMLLDAWSRLNPEGWQLVIAGNDDANHQAELEAQARRLGLSEAVHFAGPLYGDDQVQAYLDADLFVLPTYSENFGIVIAEALTHQVPVITTTGTPWGELLERDCGWWVDAETSQIQAALADAISRNESELREMGVRGQQLVKERYLWPSISEKMQSVYSWLLNEGDRPDCVMLD
jgi:glycosyltransferase involved in cell wall biosynthesis